ncbi:hypothetical protein L2E82_26465 [Cichorium intybus]|uniref:Uncharacterized protein n=1 Tax=Cichorium intybus TaxID=13427 RepID=A0ACB9CR88_CICIN|nr:hypothetical protein L2E82_26465 [Cichorium intybus]
MKNSRCNVGLSLILLFSYTRERIYSNDGRVIKNVGLSAIGPCTRRILVVHSSHHISVTHISAAFIEGSSGLMMCQLELSSYRICSSWPEIFVFQQSCREEPRRSGVDCDSRLRQLIINPGNAT